MAKLILTSNDDIQMRADAGVFMRLKYVLNMTHRFKPLHSVEWNTRTHFTKTHATPNVSHQFATRTFGLGVNSVNAFVTVCSICSSIIAPI